MPKYSQLPEATELKQNDTISLASEGSSYRIKPAGIAQTLPTATEATNGTLSKEDKRKLNEIEGAFYNDDNSTNMPSRDEKLALSGTTGTPSGTNKYVTKEGLDLLDNDLQEQIISNGRDISGLRSDLETLSGKEIVDRATISGEILRAGAAESTLQSNINAETLSRINADNGKVDKVAGKQLSTEDFTDDLKNRLDDIINYLNTNTLPASAIATNENRRFVSDAQIEMWSVNLVSGGSSATVYEGTTLVNGGFANTIYH